MGTRRLSPAASFAGDVETTVSQDAFDQWKHLRPPLLYVEALQDPDEFCCG